MAEQLTVELRDQRGKLNNRRLRRSGKIPAVLYGHGQENVCLSVGAEVFRGVIRHGSRLVELTGALSESAFIRDMQWDTWGTHVLHVDLTRISAEELVEVTLTVELRGEAPGIREGGVVNQHIHEAEISCTAGAIPEKLRVNVNNLKLGDSIALGAISLPEGAKFLAEDLEEIVVECVVPVELPEEEEAEAGVEEPEVIGAKKEDEESENEG
ncbi:MAG: 50S ribosomal protein L25 [Thermoguttaceae bacterium]